LKKKDDRPWVAVDVDMTVAAAWWRDHLFKSGAMREEDWTAYYADQESDPPIEEVVDLVRGLHDRGWGTVGLTARPEKYRAATTRWAIRRDVPLDELLMRPREDRRGSAELKVGLLMLRFPGFHGVKMVLEDRDDVVAAFRERQVTVLQVHARKR
jgi:hypothetical protein